MLKTENIVLGGGCFWCVESVFLKLKGVEKVQSGYANSKISNPTYKEVCSGLTGAIEVIEVTFDPEVISLKEILEIFFATHDPTTLNQQGADIGTQYRSAILSNDPEQLKIAKEVKNEMQAHFDKPIVTEIEPLKNLYIAEDYHQDYFNKNPENPFCQAVINPKLAKLRKAYANKLK